MYDSRYIKNEQQNWIYASLLLVQELLYFSFLKKSNKYFHSQLQYCHQYKKTEFSIFPELQLRIGVFWFSYHN